MTTDPRYTMTTTRAFVFQTAVRFATYRKIDDAIRRSNKERFNGPLPGSLNRRERSGQGW